MDENSPFAKLWARFQAGDPQAAEELLSEYKPHLQRMIRVRLRGSKLKSEMETMDVCQSVMANLYFRAQLGGVDLETPDDLLKLLATMAKHKFINKYHHHKAAKRDLDRRQTIDDSQRPVQVAVDDPSPSSIVANRELLERGRAMLTPEERHLADERAQGRSWKELGVDLGEEPDALRMRYNRALDRVAKELGLRDD